MARFRIAVIPGDGIGPEVINSTRHVLDAVGKKFNHDFKYEELLAGGIAIDTTGEPLPHPPETCKSRMRFCWALSVGRNG